MKKMCLIGLFLLTACLSPSGGQPETPEATFTAAATATRLPPTPVPVTATETLPPSPTSTLGPPPRYFTETFDSVPAYWTTLQASGDAGNIKTINQDGKLTFELYSSYAWLYAIYGAQEYATVHIETRIENSGSNTNYMGLICNYKEQDGWFEFNISSDGSYNVLFGQWLGEGVATYLPVADGSSEYLNLGSTSNQMGLECLGGSLQLYINGKLFRNIDVSRFELTGGKVGLAVASFQEVPVILSFDWVQVSEP